MRGRLAVALVALTGAAALPGCALEPEVVVVAGHDGTGRPVAGATSCWDDQDHEPVEALTATAESGEMWRLDQGAPSGSAIGPVRLLLIPEEAPGAVELRAYELEEISDPDVVVTLEPGGERDSYTVATGAGGQGGLDGQAAADRVDEICAEISDLDLGWLVGPAWVAAGVVGVFVLGCIVAALTLGRRPRRR